MSLKPPYPECASERRLLTPPKTPIPENERAGSGAPDGEKAPVDPDLAKVMAAWPKLPEHIKAAVLALVRSADGGTRP